ncbi:ABC transporter ATP-binding protein [Candidatus Bathyarchaeota archaeon]|nr:ABC transporter ATP-binding protein [Candidatus Bathyarchaeota archaeon]
MSESILKTEKLTKIFTMGKRKISALSGVNLQVNKGEFIAIMGPSGSGKTTLLNVLGCLDTPTDGMMTLNGIDVTKLSEKKLYSIRRNEIGFIFQTFNLFPYLNARENVELPMECTKKSKSERGKRSRELLEMVGLSGREEHRPHRLSAGEQQRVAIARALANNPAIVLADEPTGNLDTENKYEIVRLLGRLNINQGTTIIMVTHDSQIASHTERILFLSDGKITKEKQGLHLVKKKLMCPYCGSRIQLSDARCPSCKKRL